MTWADRLLKRRSFSVRPITVILVIVTYSLVVCLATLWLRHDFAHIPSEAETRAIRAALAQFSNEFGHGPSDVASVKATKLDGNLWIVQITERRSPEPGGLRERNTFFVGGSGCQWLGIETWGAY